MCLKAEEMEKNRSLALTLLSLSHTHTHTIKHSSQTKNLPIFLLFPSPFLCHSLPEGQSSPLHEKDPPVNTHDTQVMED